MNHLIFLAIAVLGAILIAKKDLLIQYIPNSINEKIKIVYDNNVVVGGVLIAGAYYFYTQDIKKSTPGLPSYSEATSDLASSM